MSINNIFHFLPGLKVKQSGIEFNNGDGTKTIVSMINGQDPSPGLPLFQQAAAQPQHHHPQCVVAHPFPMQGLPWHPWHQQQQICVQQHQPQPQPQSQLQPNIMIIEKENIPKTEAELKAIAAKKKKDEEDKKKKDEKEKKDKDKEKKDKATAAEKARYPLPFSRFSVTSGLFFALALVLGSVTISLTYGLEEELETGRKAGLAATDLAQRRAHADPKNHAHVTVAVNKTIYNETDVTVAETATVADEFTPTAAAAGANETATTTTKDGATGWTMYHGEYAAHRQATVGLGFATVVAFTFATVCSFFAGVRHQKGVKHKKEHGAQAFFLIASWILFATTFLMDVVILIMALNPDTPPYAPGVALGYVGSICSWCLMFGYSELTRRWM